MRRRSLFLALAIALAVGGFGALDARASSALLSDLIASGTQIQLGNDLQVLFTTYSQTTPNAPAASSVTIEWGPGSGSPFGPPGPDGLNYGFTVNGSFSTGPGTMLDAGITYTVSTVDGAKNITDAYAFVDASQTGGTGIGSATDTLNLNPAVSFAAISSTPSSGTPNPIEFTFENNPQSSIIVHKDIFSAGFTGTTLFSHIQQGYSANAVPEPASLALLGIGMTGFLAFRRFFKKTSVA
jgi:PEP-CTERM motif